MVNKKKIITFVVTAFCISLISCFTVSALSIQGVLKTNIHYVPILKDTATAYSYLDDYGNGSDTEDLQVQTWVDVYNKDGEHASGYRRAEGTAVLESWSSYIEAKAEIRAMTSANSQHRGQYQSDTVWTYNSVNK